jgi:hypothetical protein
MCEARLLFEHRKAWGDRTDAGVPAGTLDPAGGRREFDSLLCCLHGGLL